MQEEGRMVEEQRAVIRRGEPADADGDEGRGEPAGADGDEGRGKAAGADG